MAGAQADLSQETLETILAQLPFGLMVLDLEGTILICNAAAHAVLERRWGWTGTADPSLRTLPRAVRTGVEYLAEAARWIGLHRPPPSSALTSDDLSLHISLLFSKERIASGSPKKIYAVVVLESREPPPTPVWQSPSRLTPREKEVLQWLAKGKLRKEISIILGVSESTVKKHLENLYIKLGVTNRVEAAAAAVQVQLEEALMSRLGLS